MLSISSSALREKNRNQDMVHVASTYIVLEGTYSVHTVYVQCTVPEFGHVLHHRYARNVHCVRIMVAG